MAPAQFSRQRRDNLTIGEELGELDHPTETFLREAAPVIGNQLSRQRRDNHLAVGGTLASEDLREDALTNSPVEQDLGRVDGLGDAGAGHLDQRP